MQLNRRDVFRHLTIGAMALQTIPGLFAQVVDRDGADGRRTFLSG